ncbi:MAG: glycosyltransferase [Patescibacteria group bacterium]|jgi:glycosyltransferase involved in cell wall biosynthesis
MRVCYFGTYDPIYTRNRLMIQGLRENGVEVVECQTRQKKNKLKKYWQLINQHQKLKSNYDVMIVGFAGHAIMPLAWLLAKLSGKKIILDLFVSEYDSVVLDRKQVSKFSFKAFKFWLLDWLSCSLADLCLLDADEHINFFIKQFKIRKEKFKTILLSCDPKIFFPRAKPTSDKFIIHYHGSYSPIQGVSYIVKAAKILERENVYFNIIGKLNNHAKEISLAKEIGVTNVNFVDFMPYEKLADQIALADICLGMFGDTDKAMHCSAFKIVEAMAMRKAVVTGDTPALQEIITSGQTGLFCRMADAKDLADKILAVKNQLELKEKIAEGGYQFYLKNLTPKATGAELVKIINELITKK